MSSPATNFSRSTTFELSTSKRLQLLGGEGEKLAAAVFVSFVLLIAETLDELVPGRGELGKRVDESPGHQRGDILHHINQDRLVEQQMHGGPDPAIIKRRPFGIHPGRVNYALVEFRGGQAGLVGLEPEVARLFPHEFSGVPSFLKPSLVSGPCPLTVSSSLDS